MNRCWCIILWLFISCDNPTGNKTISKNATVTVKDSTSNQALKTQIPDKKYPVDTLLISRWRIKYYSSGGRNDSDLFIECSKFGRKYTFIAHNVLRLRSYFVPAFIGETKDCIYFSTACATNCKALLVFHKSKKPSFKQYNSVIEYSIPHDLVTFIDENTDDGDKYIVSIANLKNHQVKRLQFRNFCNLLPREG
ncbi:MAG TPA: hypothetical protein VM101_03200, partial [Flavitalea sp.]|nr:hypothetical protein [Flavitalea sp.]